ncbi:hypothetical protein [Oscillibacter sp.]|uniref:hypothetical protein n=1 Tax=Oscillibacter sp. TaxID=1945593 RepID=UPI00261BAD2A|nr:hypothetical protein [Oscillibacter sp.]
MAVEQGGKEVFPALLSVSKKSFRHAVQVFETRKKFQKLMIENERHPSWVSFVTIFLPVSRDFRV